MSKLARYVLHPFFTATYPVLFLLSINAGQIPLQQAGKILAISLAAALLLTLLFGAITRNFQRDGFLTSILLALFFFYGHVYNWLEKSVSFLANHIFLDILWGALLLCGIWAAYKIRNIDAVNKYFNLIMLLLLIQPVLSLGLFVYRSGIPQEIKPPSPFDNIKVNAQDKQNLPDIYYIILDGHGRSDVVKELFGYDNSAFIDYLEERGFYVADQSRSNNIQTLPVTNSDIYIPYKTTGLINSFEELVFSTSAASAIDPQIQEQWFIDLFRCENRRGYILNIFENLKKIPKIPGPKFNFAHIVAPHPPFVFNKSGTEDNVVCSLKDGSYFAGGQSEYKRGYPLQMEYIDTLTVAVVDTILEKSATPPVIIIQGDHGSGMLLDCDSSENACLRERFSIRKKESVIQIDYTNQLIPGGPERGV